MNDVLTVLTATETTGTEFGPDTEHPHGGGGYAVLIKNIGSDPVILEVEIDGDWTATGNEWDADGANPIDLPAAVKHRFTVGTAGATVLLTPIDRSARGPAF